MSIRLLIADDHPIIRESLRHVLKGPEFEIVAEAANGLDALRTALKLDIDVVLMDIRMPHMDGIEVLRRIKTARPHLPVVIYSSNDSMQVIAQCMTLGASGYLKKGASRSELISAVTAAGECREGSQHCEGITTQQA